MLRLEIYKHANAVRSHDADSDIECLKQDVADQQSRTMCMPEDKKSKLQGQS